MFLMLLFNVLYLPDELSGIFVRSISEGSAAALDGRIQLNDQIIAVSARVCLCVCVCVCV